MKNLNIPKNILDKIQETERFNFPLNDIISTIEHDKNCEYNYCYNFNKIKCLEREIEDFDLYILLGELGEVRERLNNPEWKDSFKIHPVYDEDGISNIQLFDNSPETDEEYISRLTKVFYDVDEYMYKLKQKNSELLLEKEKLINRLKEIDNILNNN